MRIVDGGEALGIDGIRMQRSLGAVGIAVGIATHQGVAFEVGGIYIEPELVEQRVQLFQFFGAVIWFVVLFAGVIGAQRPSVVSVPESEDSLGFCLPARFEAKIIDVIENLLLHAWVLDEIVYDCQGLHSANTAFNSSIVMRRAVSLQFPRDMLSCFFSHGGRLPNSTSEP